MRSCYYMTAAISLSRHVCAAQRCSSAVGPCLSAQAQLGPACRSDHEQDQHLAASVCVWNDMMKACMQETESVMSALHSVAQAQLGPACRSDHEQDPSRASRAPKSRPSAPPSTISATPATQNDGGCEFVPRLPRDIKVDVTKCHACHAKRRWL